MRLGRNRRRRRYPVEQYTGPRRFRYVGAGRVHLPAYLRGAYPAGLVAGDEFVCPRKDWSKSNGFEVVQPVAVVEPLPVVEPVVVPEPVTLTPEQFAELPFKTAREYALGLYGIKARSKAELLREYIEARG